MKPIFFIGNGRSGTTIISEVLSNHSEFGWLSNYSAKFPRIAEAYPFWQGYAGNKFLWDFLIDVKVTPLESQKINHAVQKNLFFQCKKRLLAKITGLLRIGFIRSVFPEASFIHIVRDGRAVVDSLLNVDFWKQKGGLAQPFWSGGLTKNDAVIISLKFFGCLA